MSDITFEPNDTSLEDFMNSLPPIPTPNMDVDEAEFDALIAELAQDSPPDVDLDATQPEFDPQELEAWLDSLNSATVNMDF